MIAYLRVLMLRWVRSGLGLKVLVGVTVAPTAFMATIYLVWLAFRQDVTTEPANESQTTVIAISAVFFSCLVAALAIAHLITASIHVEKQHHRIQLLRTSGFEVQYALACYLAAAFMASTLIVPLTMAGPWVLSELGGTATPRASFVIATMAAVNLLGPLVVWFRLALPQPFALTAAYATATLIAIQHVLLTAPEHFAPTAVYLLSLLLAWAVAATLLGAAAMIDQRRKNRLWA